MDRLWQVSPFSDARVPDMGGQDLGDAIHLEGAHHGEALGRQIIQLTGEASHCLGTEAAEDPVSDRLLAANPQRAGQTVDAAAVLEEAIFETQERIASLRQTLQPQAVFGQPMGGMLERRREALRHRNASIARIAQAEDDGCPIRPQPIAEFWASHMGLEHEMPAGPGAVIRHLADLIREKSEYPLFADGGGQQLANDIEHPGGGTAMQADGRDKTRRSSSPVQDLKNHDQETGAALHRVMMPGDRPEAKAPRATTC